MLNINEIKKEVEYIASIGPIDVKEDVHHYYTDMNDFLYNGCEEGEVNDIAVDCLLFVDHSLFDQIPEICKAMNSRVTVYIVMDNLSFKITKECLYGR